MKLVKHGNGRWSPMLLGLAILSTTWGAAAEEARARYTISDFTTPFQFHYQAWGDHLQVGGGRAVLKGLSEKGGAGVNKPHDLGAYTNLCPAFRLRTTAANTAKMLQLQLLDAEGRNATWRFPLPPPSENFVTVVPLGAAALAHPHTIKRGDEEDHIGPLNLPKICQFKVQGDWQKGVLDLELASITLVEPDAAMLAEREAFAKTEAAAAAQRAQQRAAEQAKLAGEREKKIRAYAYPSPNSPKVTHVSLVAPDVLALTIEAQRTVLPTMTKHEPQAGDMKRLQKRRDGTVAYATLLRKGKRLGRLQGPNLDWFFTDERLEGDPLLEFITETPANYAIHSGDDPAFAQPTPPVAVYRKSAPRDVVLPGGQHPTRHQLYLKLPARVQAGKTYTIKLSVVNVQNRELTFKADLENVRSESVHVNQIGYRPTDPVKRAFLSIWLGTGGAYTFAEGLGFALIDERTNARVFSGKVECILPAAGKETLWVKPPKNYSGTAVYRMDFSAFTTPGRYRLFVEGIGCSYPFELGPAVWEQAFLTQMKGLFNQRSGVELGPPYTDFKKPRDFHPAAGAVVTRTTHDVFAKGGSENYAAIAKGDTGEALTNAWGGYHDAGDWNPRRVTHMLTTLAQLELCELFPGYFNRLKLNIPPQAGVPDIITEALFEIDCFRRLQNPDGGIPFGIETEGDPLAGEVSWLSTQHCYVLAPNIRDSWLYAATAARAATVLKPSDPALAQTYLDSALRAFRWAEGALARKRAAGEALKPKDYWDAFDARNLAALVLYDLTGDKAYHDIFLQDTCLQRAGEEIVAWGWHIQCDQVFLYARMDAAKTDPKLRERARAGVIALAERSLKYAAGNAFNITQREPGRPMFAGFFSTAGGTELVRAHYLTGKPEYLKGAVQSCQFQSGCNPNNLVYTTGLGANPVRVPLELDARSTGQPVPAGLTVFGNSDFGNWRHSFWDINLHLVNRPEFIWPDAYSWPLTEAYFDVWVLVSANEFVIDTWAPNVLVWGYLAARPE